MATITSTSSTPSQLHPIMPCTIQCVQGNLRRSKQSLIDLFIYISNKNLYQNVIDVVFITEPPLITKVNTLVDVPDNIFNVFTEKYGRAALVTQGMITWRCPQFCARDIVVCQTKLNNHLTYLISMYLDQQTPDFPNEFRELIHKLDDNDVIIGTDSNSHSTVWNCPQTDIRGKFIEEFLIENNLTCLNFGNNPTFKNGRGDTSIIDLMIANYRLASSVSNWRVEKYLHPPTDNFRVTYSINDCPNFRCADVEDWNFKKGDWSSFKNDLEKRLFNWTNARIWSDKTIEQKLHFLDELVEALNLACLKKLCKRKFKFPPWWDQNLSKLR